MPADHRILKVLRGISATTSPASVERQNVQQVYDSIADHFSNTRYKPWPVIADFLTRLDHGSLVADVGCGNGKYMAVNDSSVQYVGSDFSVGLAGIACKLRPRADVVVADALRLPYRSGAFDHALSIAVIHHLASEERRIAAVSELLRIVRPGGRVLIYVWAMEQGENARYDFQEQDVHVPWHLSGPGGPGPVYNRFYHVFKRGELENITMRASIACGIPVSIDRADYDHQNWYVVATISP